MAHHEVISRSGNAFLLNIRESVLLPGSMSEMHFFLLIGISSIHSDRVILAGFAPIFPDICYHLTHYKPAAADIPVASDNPAHYADAIRYNA
ncbi:PapB/FocB family fimbrial expression transcriptional regulator, partial [Escherichia coli]